MPKIDESLEKIEKLCRRWLKQYENFYGSIRINFKNGIPVNDNIELTEKKSVVLQDCIEKKLIEHPLFRDVSRFAPLLFTKLYNASLIAFSGS